MIKDILQLIGILALVLVAVCAIFFLLDNVHLLSGALGDYVAVMHASFKTMTEATKAFISGSGLADEAAALLDSGANKLRDVADDLAHQNGVGATPEPEAPAETYVPDPSSVSESGMPAGQDPTAVTETPIEIVFATPVPEA